MTFLLKILQTIEAFPQTHLSFYHYLCFFMCSVKLALDFRYLHFLEGADKGLNIAHIELNNFIFLGSENMFSDLLAVLIVLL